MSLHIPISDAHSRVAIPIPPYFMGFKVSLLSKTAPSLGFDFCPCGFYPIRCPYCLFGWCFLESYHSRFFPLWFFLSSYRICIFLCRWASTASNFTSPPCGEDGNDSVSFLQLSSRFAHYQMAFVTRPLAPTGDTIMRLAIVRLVWFQTWLSTLVLRPPIESVISLFQFTHLTMRHLNGVPYLSCTSRFS